MTLTQADNVEVVVVVDNATDILSSTPPLVTGELARLLRRRISPTVGEAYCCAAHGLSLLITAFGPRGPKSVMFDAGPAGDVLAMNAARLDIDLAAIDAFVLSHGHWDHAGGLRLRHIIIGHCTGWRALNALQNAFGDQAVVPMAVGKQFSF